MSSSVEVQLSSLGKLRELWERDLSLGRLFVASESALQIWQKVEVRFVVDGEALEFGLKGEVVFARPPEQCAAGQDPGVGLTVTPNADFARAIGVSYPGVAAPVTPKGGSPGAGPTSGGGKVRSTRAVPKNVAMDPVGGQDASRGQRPAKADVDELAALSLKAKGFLRRVRGRTLYCVLDLPASAERERIRARYIELIRLYHPDNYFRRAKPDLQSLLEEVYQLITKAHETLIDPERRAIYDDEIRNFDAPGAGGGEERAARIRARTFEKRNPRMAELAGRLIEESRVAMGDQQFTEAVRKVKLALSYHPHLPEARQLLHTLEQEGHSG